MPDLPGGSFTIIAVCGVGLVIALAFGVKVFRFSYHRRRGSNLFEQRNYRSALRHLIHAERLWMFRLSKQTTQSRIEDCRNLGMVLDLLGRVAEHCSLIIETKRYREAPNDMQRFFLSDKTLREDYPTVYSSLIAIQKDFRRKARNLSV
jgi:hypothetical protein